MHCLFGHKWTMMDRIHIIAFVLQQPGTTFCSPRGTILCRYPQNRPMIVRLAEMGTPILELQTKIHGLHKFVKDLRHRHLLVRKHLRKPIPVQNLPDIVILYIVN